MQNKLPQSITVIKDDVIAPYFIGQDQNCYTVYKNVVPGTNTKGRGRKTRTQESIKTLSFHTTFDSCLSSIAKLKLTERLEYNSIRDYINEWEKISNQITQTFKTDI